MVALLFLPLAMGGGSVTLQRGERLTVTCADQLLAVLAQSRTSISMECVKDEDLPYVPTPEAESE